MDFDAVDKMHDTRKITFLVLSHSTSQPPHIKIPSIKDTEYL